MRLLPVLIRPLYSGNVGSALRVAANFAVPEIVLVEPRCDLGALELRRMAMGAQELVRMTVVEDLARAIGGADVTVTTTSGRNRDPRNLYSPRQVAERIAAPGVALAALVFGSERGGLTQQELTLGHLHMVIPTSPAFPTLNLAQSMAISLAFLLEGGLEVPAPEDPLDAPGGAAGVDTAIEHLERALLDSGFLDQQNPARIMKQLRSWLTRAVPSKRELAVLRAIASHVTYLGRKAR